MNHSQASVWLAESADVILSVEKAVRHGMDVAPRNIWCTACVRTRVSTYMYMTIQKFFF